MTDPVVVQIPVTYQHYVVVPASANLALDVTTLPATGALAEQVKSGDSIVTVLLLLLAACSLFGFGVALRRSVIEHVTTDF